MSTSDQQGQVPLTRKQMREMRATGAAPAATEEVAPVAAPAPFAPPLPDAVESPVAPIVPPAPAEPVAKPVEPQHESILEEPESPSVEASPTDTGDHEEAPLTRRQAREQERVRTASVPVIDPTADVEVPAVVPERSAALEQPSDIEGTVDYDSDGVDDEQVAAAPVSASHAVADDAPSFAAAVEEEPIAVEAEDTEAENIVELEPQVDVEEVFAEAEAVDTVIEAGDERPTVNAAFGEAVLGESQTPFAPSFDDLLTTGDSAGSHTAPNALIFTPSPGEGSLSGPVASTGEILVTGSYELPRGMGSQGHAHGVTDGKDVDSVLIDGELPPASSPTPIAASAAVSTIKPAGEVIRPPAPDKGNRLMLILAIVAGGLALALGVALVFAFTTNVF